MKGPIEGIYGLFEGGTSLVKHTVGGTFNSVSKITDSVS